MQHSSNFPIIVDLSRKAGLDDVLLRKDFLQTSERNKEGNIRRYKFFSCHGNLCSEALELLNEGETPSMRDFLNMACHVLDDVMPIRTLRYLQNVENEDTYHITYSARERFPHTEFVYDEFGANWQMNDFLDYLFIVHRPADPIWEIGIEEGALVTLALHYILCQLSNIAKMALAAESPIMKEGEDPESGKLRRDNNVSKSLLLALVLSRAFLKDLILAASARENEPLVYLKCGDETDHQNILKASIRQGKIHYDGENEPPKEWQVLADLVPSTFTSSGTPEIDDVFVQAVASCLERVDQQSDFEFTRLQDHYDTIMLGKSEKVVNLVNDLPRVQNFLDDLDDIEIDKDFAHVVHDDWRNAEEDHLATTHKWRAILSVERIDGIKVRPFSTGMTVEQKGPEKFKLYNKDKSLAMIVKFSHEGLSIVRKGTFKDLVKRFTPFTEFNVMGNGAKFKDNWVAVSRGDPADIANAVFAGCYGPRAAIWLLGKLAFSSTGADMASPAVIAGRQDEGVRIRSTLGRNVVSNMIFLTDYHHVYMFYPGTYRLKKLVHKGDYYECVDTDVMGTSQMKACKLASLKEIM